MNDTFLDTINTGLLSSVTLPTTLSKFLISLDKDIDECNYKDDFYGQWESEVLNNEKDIGLRAKIVFSSADFKSVFKNDPVFNNNSFTVSLAVGKFNRETLRTCDDDTDVLINFYNKHSQIIFFILESFPLTNKFSKEIGIKEFSLTNFTLKYLNDNQSSYGGDYGGDYGGETQSPAIVMSATLHSTILDMDIEISIKTINENV